MAQKKKAVKPKAQIPSIVALSARSRGTSGFKLFLIKLLGKELDYCPKYLINGSDSHFPLGQRHLPVNKYLMRYSSEAAAAVADAIFVFPLLNPNESQLCNFLTMYIFFAPISLQSQIYARP